MIHVLSYALKFANVYPGQYFVTAPAVSKHSQSCVASCEHRRLLLLLIMFFSLQKTPATLDKFRSGTLLSAVHIK